MNNKKRLAKTLIAFLALVPLAAVNRADALAKRTMAAAEESNGLSPEVVDLRLRSISRAAEEVLPSFVNW